MDHSIVDVRVQLYRIETGLQLRTFTETFPGKPYERDSGTAKDRGDRSLGKCNLCHGNAGATANLGAGNLGNANFNTGVEDLPDQPARLTGALVPPDDGFGRPGDGTFNIPPLVEAADTGPFFHNNAVQTIEGAVAFYDGESFNNSPAGRQLAGLDPNGTSIELDATQIVAVAAFLRVINALENIRQSIDLLDESIQKPPAEPARTEQLLGQAIAETDDSIRVLAGAGLHPEAVAHLQKARRLTEKARHHVFGRRHLVERAIREQRQARRELIEEA